MTVKAVSFAEAKRLKADSIPESVVEAVNELVVQGLFGNRSIVKQRDVERNLAGRGFRIEEVIDNGWLDFEPLFESEGWHVTYSKPDFNEPGERFWTFTAVE